MGLDIAIYNGMSGEGQKIINSIKSAYLYSDHVRVYDFFLPLNIDRDSILSLIPDNPDARELIRLITDNIDDDFFSWDKILPENMDYHTAMKILCDELNKNIMKNHFIQSYSLGELRDRDFSDNSWEQCVKKLKKMGVRYIAPLSETELGYHVSYPTIQFLNDKGFKVINDTSILPIMSLHPTSIWSPAYLSEYVVSTLPGFEDATLDEIVDIREELDKYVIPFRAAIIKMAQTIKEVPNSDSFQRDCMTVYLREIEPQVAAINAAIDDNNVFKNIAKKVVTNKETWASVGALVTAFATTGDIANAVSIGAATALAGLSITEGIVSTLEEKKKIKDNEMFFLYEAGQRLKK